MKFEKVLRKKILQTKNASIYLYQLVAFDFEEKQDEDQELEHHFMNLQVDFDILLDYLHTPESINLKDLGHALLDKQFRI